MINVIDLDGIRQMYPKFNFKFKFEKELNAEIVTISYRHLEIKRAIPYEMLDSFVGKDMIELTLINACEALKSHIYEGE